MLTRSPHPEPPITAAVCALLQTMADYAALQEPFYLSKLIPAEYLPSRINC
jgi:hypothetical protein